MSGLSSRLRTILISVRLNFQSGRDILHGISLYARKHCRWQYHIITDPDGPMAAELRDPDAFGIDGIVADSVSNAHLWPFLAKTRIPLVQIGDYPREARLRRPNMAFVRNDDRDVGTSAAKFLASLGQFASYGFVTATVEDYCIGPRRDGFCSFFDALRKPVSICRMPNDSASDIPPEAINRLARWLRDLPKPAAVMAIHDKMAMSVLDAAHQAKIRIPGELVLLGVDNDELLCDFSSPPLSSIAVDHVREGEIAAKALHDLMRGKFHDRGAPLFNTRKSLVERQSTHPIPPGTALVRHAAEFIRREAVHGIGASDVAEHLGVSRRLADLRFRQFAGQSILSAILTRRLDELKRRLSEADDPINRTVLNCGFHNLGHAKKLFKSRFGMSMRDWRNVQRST